MKYNKKDIKILTPDGYKPFSGMQKLFKSCLKVEWGDRYLECSKNHRICVNIKENLFKLASELSVDDFIESTEGLVKITNISDIGEHDVYDLLNVEGNCFITNDIISHNCEFDEVGDAAIDQSAYEEMRVYCRDPLFELEDGCYKIWENPSPDRIYVAGVDVSEGIGKDYSVVQIIDITDPTQIQQVACYASNKIQPVHFTKKLREILQNWGDPLACIERNACGCIIVDNLRKDFNYVNIVNWGSKEANTGTKKVAQLGMICHTSTKNKAVANYLYWVGTAKQVRFNDLQTVNEIKDFVRKKGGSHSAKAGSNDDRVMSLVWALMMLSDEICDKYFEIVDKDIYHKPTIIRPMDYGIKYFYNPTSIYDTSDNRDILPTFLGSPVDGDPELDDLRSHGWRPLQF